MSVNGDLEYVTIFFIVTIKVSRKVSISLYIQVN